VTVKLQIFELPEPSTATQRTCVPPRRKKLPELGEQISVGFRSQLSLAETLNGTKAPFDPKQLAKMFVGHEIVGGCRSRMVMVKVQVAVFPAASWAVQVTVVTPRGKVEPEGGVQVTLESAQLSVAGGV
jgi:hypothetical protein